MKIIQHCPVCQTTQESVHDWDSIKEMYQADLDEPEFAHDEGNRDCGGTLEYSFTPIQN